MVWWALSKSEYFLWPWPIYLLRVLSLILTRLFTEYFLWPWLVYLMSTSYVLDPSISRLLPLTLTCLSTESFLWPWPVYLLNPSSDLDLSIYWVHPLNLNSIYWVLPLTLTHLSTENFLWLWPIYLLTPPSDLDIYILSISSDLDQSACWQSSGGAWTRHSFLLTSVASYGTAHTYRFPLSACALHAASVVSSVKHTVSNSDVIQLFIVYLL
jgi:hypothetical protein